ncbi:MAG TPA: phosphoenolpyruvate carboxylase [Actinomycetes bacterium]
MGAMDGATGRREQGAGMPAPLRRDVRLLGGLLGQVLEEAGGPELLADVERLRRATIALREARQPEHDRRRREVVELVGGFDLDRAEAVARAFTVYLQLVNLAEERHRVRILRERGRGEGPVKDSLAAAVAVAREEEGEPGLARLLGRLEVNPVLTAHPTEARRRAVVDALRRVGEQVDRLDDPRLSTSEEADVRRRLLEEISILWRTAQLRSERPGPLDEVRSVMSVFDESLFRLVPSVYRELDQALAGGTTGTGPPAFGAWLRWGSWVGGDRDGNPTVTAGVTRATLAIHADHLLRGLEAATRRIGRSLTASAATTPPSPALSASLGADAADLPAAVAAIRKRSPGEPHRQKLLLAAERLAATRAVLVPSTHWPAAASQPRGSGEGQDAASAYPGPDAYLADLRLVQASLVAAGAPRLAYGELQHLVWQAETFGFHLASLEVRQHASVHALAVRELTGEDTTGPASLDRLATEGWPAGTDPDACSEQTREALATLRVMAELQERHGPAACRRYVVSFTRSAADLAAVRALGRLAVPDGSLALEVVPLFESRADLQAATTVLDEYLALPGVAAELDGRGRRLEVMLGYSDSAKDAGFLAANLALYRAQGELAAWARDHHVELVLFHGRGGALGRGGGPANRAVRGQAPGSVAGRFKVTDQGEVIFARYGNPAIGLRHLEQVTNAVLLASTPAAEAALRRAGERFAAAAERMAAASERAYRALVAQPGFADFFARVTPIDEISRLPLGSRPARRDAAGAGAMDLAALRAIPWVFAWGQTRCNLPGWYGLGSGLEAVAGQPDGLELLRAMHTEWPFFASLLENAEMSLAKADPMIAELYLDLGGRPELKAMIAEEYRRTRALVLAVGGGTHLLDRRPILRRAVVLRNPYVDALSFLQVRALATLRSGGPDTRRMAELVLLTAGGVAAGLQNTG